MQPDAGQRRTAELAAAMRQVAYEVEIGVLAGAFSQKRSGPSKHGFLARALSDFLVRTQSRASDIRRTDFAPEWEPGPVVAVERLVQGKGRLDKHLAHLTWARVDRPWTWNPPELVSEVVAVTKRGMTTRCRT